MLKCTAARLKELAVLLERAGAVSVNNGEDPVNVQRWKALCADNYAKVKDVLDGLKPFTQVMDGVSAIGKWPECATELKRIADEMDVPLATGDEYAFLWHYGFAETEKVGLFVGFGEKCGEYIAELEKLHGEDGMRDLADARVEEVEKACSELMNEVEVPVNAIDFKCVPQKLHGGYFRDLKWQVSGIPEDFGGFPVEEEVRLGGDDE